MPLPLTTTVLLIALILAVAGAALPYLAFPICLALTLEVYRFFVVGNAPEDMQSQVDWVEGEGEAV
jgi:hypothetical protein